jgi:hypothetical protein
MDYGDGKLRFVYQFNSKYRKYEVCKAIDGSIPVGDAAKAGSVLALTCRVTDLFRYQLLAFACHSFVSL